MPPATDQKRILAIEDEFFISELYDRALRKAGYAVTAALNGIDGLELAKSGQYDVILLDLMVPGITGIEILRELRGPSVPSPFSGKIVITTNLDQKESSRAEIEAMADGYLIKAEITPKELVSFVTTLLQSSETTS